MLLKSACYGADQVGVILIGLGLTTGALTGHANLALTLGPAVIAIAAVLLVLASRRWIADAQLKLARKRGHRARLARSLGAIRNWSMTLVFDEVVPWLREQGVMDDESFHTVFTENPKRWLTA